MDSLLYNYLVRFKRFWALCDFVPQESAFDGVLSNESLERGDDLRKMGAPGLRPAVILMKFEQLGNGASMRMTRSNERQALIELERIDHAT